MTDESVFAAALAIPRPADRAAYLEKACAGNPRSGAKSRRCSRPMPPTTRWTGRRPTSH